MHVSLSIHRYHAIKNQDQLAFHCNSSMLKGFVCVSLCVCVHNSRTHVHHLILYTSSYTMTACSWMCEEISLVMNVVGGKSYHYICSGPFSPMQMSFWYYIWQVTMQQICTSTLERLYEKTLKLFYKKSKRGSISNIGNGNWQ